MPNRMGSLRKSKLRIRLEEQRDEKLGKKKTAIVKDEFLIEKKQLHKIAINKMKRDLRLRRNRLNT
jgi:hypothetical protein